MAVEIVMPNLGITVESGLISEWLKNEGDSVEKGEGVFVVESDKVATEVESPASGVLAKILVPLDQEVPIFTVVGLIAEQGENIADLDLSSYLTTEAAQEVSSEATAPVESSPAPQAAAPTQPAVGDGRAVPAARKLAGDHQLDLTALQGSGPEGVILLKDVQAAVASGTEANRASTLATRLAATEDVSLEDVTGTGVRGRIMRSDVEGVLGADAAQGLSKIIPMDTMRKTISRRMSESAFTAPHIYFFSDIEMTPLLDFRKQLLPDFEEKYNLRPSINDFLIKAVSLNILEFPILNGQLHEDEIHIMPEVNVSLAVALPKGLIVPALSCTDQASLAEIVNQRTDLVARAKDSRLTREELARGTFTISSLAMFDITHFTAILNPPQSGILSVGKTRDELYLDTDGSVKSRKVATFGLSVDHRIIDGATAADFLQNLKAKMENPIFTFLH
ncbi:dihydrolipoamide acetyltransferase family protein [Desulfopila sp. IMCC35008]|uniref:dihydrolipoamide acetyltransferase family protein n=1 Tax=Desulfopila sp. IMCC35008 TaxID=2653858 RepID=UPI0013D7142A|nr:dihydrolipoamide acetyltransferase family protein [Desulfopila sp. IMCC35008]